MTLQDAAVFVVVVGAVAFLAWKWFFASRTPKVKKGPDVPVSRLVRKRR